MKIKEWLDKNLAKFISRKLLVFFIACAFLIVGKIQSDEWMATAIAYVGMEGFADLAIRWKTGTIKNLNKNE